MKRIELNITNCSHCPYNHSRIEQPGTYCKHEDAKSRDICYGDASLEINLSSLPAIPDWCPLPEE